MISNNWLTGAFPLPYAPRQSSASEPVGELVELAHEVHLVHIAQLRELMYRNLHGI